MRRLTIQQVMLITLFVLMFALAVRIPVDTDTWWHIRSGEYTLNEGMIYEDPFSYTMQGVDWTNHSWGSQIILYGVWQLAGNIGLAFYTAGLATAGMAVLYRLCAGSVYLRAFVLVLGASTAAVFWSPRPHMMSFLLSTVILYILFRYKHDKVDRVWFIPPIMAVWGNLHAGFTIGFIFMGGVIAGEVLGNLFNRGGEQVVPWPGVRKLVLVGIVSAAALIINPYGLRMLLVPFETVSIGALRQFIQEWTSPDFQQRQTWPFIFMLIGLLGSVGASTRKLDWTHFVLISGTTFMALNYGRNIAVFAVVATPVLSYHLDAMLTERGWVLHPITRVTKQQARLNAFIVGAVAVGALSYAVWVLNDEMVDTAQRRFLPVDVAEFIAENRPPGPMFNSYNWGGYLMFALPDYPVYVDGRTDLYGDEFLSRYLDAALAGEDWRDILDEDGVNLVVIETGSPLALNLAEEPGWVQIYPDEDHAEDGQAVIFARAEGAN